MKTENKILKKVVNSLLKQTGISIEYNNALNDKETDYQINIIVPDEMRSRMISCLVEIKPRVNNTIISNLAIKAKYSTEHIVLISEYISPLQAEMLRELNISFFDTAGNAYFNKSGLYIYISGRKVEITQEKPLTIFSPSGIKLILALILSPGLENFDYRTIAEDTEIPKTTIGRLLSELEKRGFLIRRQNKRFLIHKEELIKRWVEAYSEKYRVKLKSVRFHSTKHTGRWWEKIDITEYNAVWGGETGAAILTKHLRPQTATIYADSALARLQAKYGLIRDEQGEIEILRRFWKFGEVGDVAPPLVVYADLLATADERNIETAQIIYDKYLAQIAEGTS